MPKTTAREAAKPGAKGKGRSTRAQRRPRAPPTAVELERRKAARREWEAQRRAEYQAEHRQKLAEMAAAPPFAEPGDVVYANVQYGTCSDNTVLHFARVLRVGPKFATLRALVHVPDPAGKPDPDDGPVRSWVKTSYVLPVLDKSGEREVVRVFRDGTGGPSHAFRAYKKWDPTRSVGHTSDPSYEY